jgi:hypothetical protein
VDAQEKIVNDYLVYKGYESIEYEPDGNIPPDFLVDGSIAIEVRRLNQHYESEDGETTGLEVTSFPLYGLVHDLLDSYDQLFTGKTYFVYLRFRRPLGKGKVVRNTVKEALDEFSKSPSVKTTEIKINNNLSLKIFPAGTPREGKLYLMAGYTDRDSGGWVLSELERNILICSEEKLQKVEKYRSSYPTWWLALVDHIGHGIGDDEKRHLNNGLLSGHDWDKVIIVNPLNSQEAYEI